MRIPNRLGKTRLLTYATVLVLALVLVVPAAAMMAYNFATRSLA